MKKYISAFHYLTQDLPYRSHAEQALTACEAGANWIQYRCLSKSDEEMLPEIHEVAAICDDWGATLILTDHYHLLDRVDAQGVHLEDMNADFAAIREIITEEKTMGASANSFADIQRIALSSSVDYAGCGPFALTQTKPNDYPLLGLEGYRDIVRQMEIAGIDLPLLAVGGIQITDVEELMHTGVFGVAVSAAVNLAEDPADAFRQIYRKIV